MYCLILGEKSGGIEIEKENRLIFVFYSVDKIVIYLVILFCFFVE